MSRATDGANVNRGDKGGGAKKPFRRVLTCGTFDMMHYDLLQLLKRAASLGDCLVVALLTDEFNAQEGKTCFYTYEQRFEILESYRLADLVIPADSLEQVCRNVERYAIDVVAVTSDCCGYDRFSCLRGTCELVYLEEDLASGRENGRVNGPALQ